MDIFFKNIFTKASVGDVLPHAPALSHVSHRFHIDRTLTSPRRFILKTTREGLTVGLDGETQGNGYQDTLARLRMNFAAEEEASISSRTRTPHTATPGSPETPDRNLPKTGDETNMLPYCIAALISGTVLLLFGLSALKKTREETEVRA